MRCRLSLLNLSVGHAISNLLAFVSKFITPFCGGRGEE
jgi:hypothetical protein